MNPQLSVAEIDDRITSSQNTSSQFLRSHPNHVAAVHDLAELQWLRLKDDLDECIMHHTEAILLPPLYVPGPVLKIVQILFILALALRQRFRNFDQFRAEDVQYNIEYLRCLRGLPLDPFNVPRNHVTASLVVALCLQVELGSRDAIRNMKEMVFLCRELLASNISKDFPITAFISLFHIYSNRCQEWHDKLADEVIGCLRGAVKVRQPQLHRVYFMVATALYFRFTMTGSRDDYEEARAIFEKIGHPQHLGEKQDAIQTQALVASLALTWQRGTIFDNPENFEESLSRSRSILGSASLPESDRSFITWALSLHAGLRVEDYGPNDRQEASSERVGIARSHGIVVSEHFSVLDAAVRETYSNAAVEQKILDLKNLLSNTHVGTSHHTDCLDRLARWYETKFSRTNDVSDIEEIVKYRRLSLRPNIFVRSADLSQLCSTLLFAFNRTNKISYLDEAISIGHDILKLKSAGRWHFNAIRYLVGSLLARYSMSHRMEDLIEVIRLTPLAVNDQYARAPDRFEFSSFWAGLVRRIGHPSISEAYKKAMALMQDSLTFFPTIQMQHDRFFQMGGLCKRIPLDYASYQVDLGQLEAAIETLEQGRALLWFEMRGLRIPIADPIEEDLPLAKKLAEINQELEVVTTSIPPSWKLDDLDLVIQGGDGTDAFGRLVVKQRKLSEERDALISQVQGRPGFERFWKTSSFATLRSAASHGPVIIINHCEWRSDILILLSNAPPSLIPTHKDVFGRASELRDQLLDVRNKHGLDSNEYELTLGTVLSELYRLVGGPVIQRLRELGIPEQSRIWWCPTSVFCSLPLHAMGPIPLTEDELTVQPQYISDLYICSYTPTLSALIQCRSRNSHISYRPSLLLVAQPDTTLPEAKAEIDVIQSQRQVQVKSLISEDATSSAVIEGLKDHQLVHFTCHGTLEKAKPFDASFELHGNDRLTLLEIVRSQLPSAEFAFLAACHTAELTDESMADEGLHLVAAMQYCGFRSVVGTMWAMADIDGPVLAKHFYKAMFSKKNNGVPYYERSAEALRDAVQKLRRKRISLERWVNFVHYGA